MCAERRWKGRHSLTRAPTRSPVHLLLLEASLRAVGLSCGATAVVACDGGDAAEAAALAALVRPAGVLHAAGLLADRLLQRLPASHVVSPFQPKAFGAARLHAATAIARVQALVLFSLVASTVGNTGQANYAAANASLDALARPPRVFSACSQP